MQSSVAQVLADAAGPAASASSHRAAAVTVSCHDCGLRQDVPPLAPGYTASCPRCGAVLRRVVANPLDRVLALAIAGLILFVTAMTLPLMSMSMAGRVEAADLPTGVVQLYEQGLWELAVVVAVTTIVAPALYLGAALYVLIGLRIGRPPPGLPRLFRWIDAIKPWAMIEVYILGVFVAYVKLTDFATVDIGVALYALAVLALVLLLAQSAFDADAVWEEMERRGVVRRPAGAPSPAAFPCHACGSFDEAPERAGRCPRCGAARHRRKPDSIARCTALVLAAAILYIPANLYPVMTVISFGSGSPDTILSGVEELLLAGMWPLALLVFFASITVPMLKLLGLVLLVVTTRLGSAWRLRERTQLYRIVEGVGRWSMIDIFMLSILVSLVRLGSIATIEPGVGAVCFAGVVVITMFAAMAFDPRVMWDAAGMNRD